VRLVGFIINKLHALLEEKFRMSVTVTACLSLHLRNSCFDVRTHSKAFQ